MWVAIVIYRFLGRLLSFLKEVFNIVIFCFDITSARKYIPINIKMDWKTTLQLKYQERCNFVNVCHFISKNYKSVTDANGKMLIN